MSLLMLLFKINLSLLVFYLVYRLALRKLTFFNFNRVYLLSAIIISAIIPFLEYSTTARSQIQSMQVATGIYPATLLPRVASSTGLSITDLALSFYWAGVIVMAAVFLIQCASLILFYRNTRKEQVAGQTVRTSASPVSPFSFFGSIFVNPWEHNPEALLHILAHESVHARQWHSIDILAGELKRIFCWFNPAAWLLLRAIRENLEFIADRKVLEGGTDARQYQYALLATQQSSRSHSLSNHFNLSQLKFRIKMMNRSKSSDLQALKYLLTVPVVSALLLLTGLSRAKENPAPLPAVKNNALPEASLTDFTRAAVQPYHDLADTSLLTPPEPPVPSAAPPAPPQPESNIHTAGIAPNRITTTIEITEETVDGRTIQQSSRIKARDVKYLTINTDPDNKENTKVHSNAISTSFKKDDYKIYIDGERFYASLTELNPKAIRSISILSGQHAVAFDPKLGADEKIIVIETNKEKNTQSLEGQPFQVFPNPAASYWTIKTTQSGADNRYELIDRNGNKKSSGKLDQSTQINAENLPGGIYLLKLRIAGKNYETRLEKQIN